MVVKMSRIATRLPVAALACVLLAGCGSKQAQAPTYSSPTAPQYVIPAGQQFQGRRSKDLGTIVVHKRSVLHWASAGVVFQLWDAGQRIKVRTQEHVGQLTVAPGTYRKVSVIAFSNWLITISPG